MSRGVFTNNLRFQFVKGWLTGGTDPADGSVEAGDYTEYPMEVTGASVAEILDKIAEIFYRVKFAAFTDNTLSGGGLEGGTVTGVMLPRVQGLSDPVLFFETMMNGYWAIDMVDFPCSTYSLDYLGDSYEVEFIDELVNSYTWTFRDIAEKEPGLWLPLPTDSANENPWWNTYSGDEPLTGTGNSYWTIQNFGFQTAFSWYSQSDGAVLDPPTIPIPYMVLPGDPPAYENTIVVVTFSGKISVVGDMEDFYNPANRFFIGLRCRMSSAGVIDADTLDQPGLSSSSATYVIRLPSGDLSCPLESNVTLTGSLIHEPTEWFPYDRNADPRQIWDSATGEKVPIDAPYASSASDEDNSDLYLLTF